jgi:hypothetical protein
MNLAGENSRRDNHNHNRAHPAYPNSKTLSKNSDISDEKDVVVTLFFFLLFSRVSFTYHDGNEMYLSNW